MLRQDDPVPPPTPIFSSDFGNSHDPAGLGLGARAPRAPVATLLLFDATRNNSACFIKCIIFQ